MKKISVMLLALFFVLVLFCSLYFVSNDGCVTDSNCQVRVCKTFKCENKYAAFFRRFFPQPLGCVAPEFWAKECECRNFKCEAVVAVQLQKCNADYECVMASHNMGPDLPSIYCECTNLKTVSYYDYINVNEDCPDICFCNTTTNRCETRVES